MRNSLAESVFPNARARGGLPVWSYDSEELFELEKEHVFHRNWFIAGHVSEIPERGDYLTLDVAGERALVVRGRDDRVRAFHNLCRHRGSRVVAEARGSGAPVDGEAALARLRSKYAALSGRRG